VRAHEAQARRRRRRAPLQRQADRDGPLSPIKHIVSATIDLNTNLGFMIL
jgi:hypothetical protein